jgi:hypothetical protein
MTTQQQNQFAQYLESATQKEIKQMAEYAIDHLDKPDDLLDLLVYIGMALGQFDDNEETQKVAA